MIVVGYCGRFDAEKGIKDLIEAIQRVKRMSTRPIVLKLMGKSAYRYPLDDQIASLSRENEWLEVLPPVPNNQVASFLQNVDIFVLPSRIMEDHQEHDAHVLLEALASGLPCIGTRSGIIPEIIGDGTGLLVNPGKPEEIAHSIMRLIVNRELYNELVKRARKKAEQEFSTKVVARKRYEFFKTIVNENRKET